MDDGGDGARAEGAFGCPGTQEQLTAPAVTSPTPEIGHDGLTHVDWKRETFETASFAPYEDLSLVPVEVLEPKACHLAGAKPETHEQGENGVVPPPDPPSAITAFQQSRDLVAAECPWQSTASPTGDGGHGPGAKENSVRPVR